MCCRMGRSIREVLVSEVDGDRQERGLGARSGPGAVEAERQCHNPCHKDYEFGRSETPHPLREARRTGPRPRLVPLARPVKSDDTGS